MRLEVVDARPPNFADIVAVFPGADAPGVMFAYGGRIYAPGARHVPPWLHAHEGAHIARQGDAPDAWWSKYLSDKTFRLEEEILGHQAEYAAFCRRHIDGRKQRLALRAIAEKLASPLYGSMVDAPLAARLVSATVV